MKYFLKQKHSLALAMIAFAFAACSNQQGIKNLRVEMRTAPIGIDVQQPRFSWQIVSGSRNINQIAYQVMVAKSPAKLKEGKNLVWNSGKVESSNSILIPYGGEPLLSRARYYWKVKVWTSDRRSAVSGQGTWSMAFMSPGDWKASWIGIDSMMNPGDKLDDSVKTRLAARYLRKEFPLDRQVKAARIYISGLGLYECYLNGKKISHDIFAPAATDYSKQVNYNVYEVGNLLRESSRNTICVILGNGRFVSMRMAPDKKRGVPPIRNYAFPKLLLQLEVEYKNGKKAIIVSDTSWKITTHGPVIANSEYDGEEYNANLELRGWMQNGYNDKAWLNARIVSAPGGTLVAQRNPNIVTMQKIQPVSIKEVAKGRYILDMGQNMVGWLAVHLQGKKNRPIVMRFSENLKSDGTLSMDNNRGANVTNIYTPATFWMFNWEPLFTCQEFRYAEITGIDYMPKLSDFTGKINYDEMENTGSFTCSDSTLNRIYKNARWDTCTDHVTWPIAYIHEANMPGDLVTWYYENLAGIRTDKVDVGFKKIIMKPFFPDELNYVKASHQSPYGEIRSEWKKDSTSLSWKISIPPNSSALVSIPAVTREQVTEGGQKVELSEGIKYLNVKDGFVNLEVGSGNYEFKVSNKQ